MGILCISNGSFGGAMVISCALTFPCSSHEFFCQQYKSKNNFLTSGGARGISSDRQIIWSRNRLRKWTEMIFIFSLENSRRELELDKEKAKSKNVFLSFSPSQSCCFFLHNTPSSGNGEKEKEKCNFTLFVYIPLCIPSESLLLLQLKVSSWRISVHLEKQILIESFVFMFDFNLGRDLKRTRSY